MPRRPDRDLRADLLSAARAALATPQPLVVPSLRSIAAACQVKPSAVYWHFPSEADLRSAVLDAEYASLVAAVESGLDRAEAAGADPLVAAGDAYVDWGLEHPGAYQLLFEGDDAIPETRADAGPRVQDRVVALARRVDAEAPFAAALLLWSTWHGIVSLRLHKPHWDWGMTAHAANAQVVRRMVARPEDQPE